MAAVLSNDPQLAALVDILGLEPCDSSSEWETRLQERIPEPTRSVFRSLRTARLERATQASLAALSAEADFYRFVGSHTDLLRLMLEGRLGYYAAVLPQVAALIAQGPHERIADLGSYGGITAMYLAKCFPQAQIIGIERCAELVQWARQFWSGANVPNVEFLHSDYTATVRETDFDVILSLQTMPTYLLPRTSSASPETYLRGSNLERMAAELTAPGQIVARTFMAVRQLCRGGGRLLLHERIRDFPYAVLFLYLAARAGWRIGPLHFVTWRTANERDSDQKSPLILAVAQEAPAAFDEPSLLDFYLSPRARSLPPEHEMRGGAILTGPQAQLTFEALSGRRRDVCVEVVMMDGSQLHIHFGKMEPALAYLYTCTSLDFRELKICDGTFRQQLFQPAVDYITQLRQASGVASISPGPTALQAQLATIGC